MMQVGNFRAQTQTWSENQAAFGAWCITSSPLILSFDITQDDLVERFWPIISNTVSDGEGC